MAQAERGVPFAFATPLAPAVPVRFPEVAQNPHALSQKIMNELLGQDFTRGMAEALWRNKQCMPLSYWILDNSASMWTNDGHRLVKAKDGSYTVAASTRWTELKQSAQDHVQLAAILHKTTHFHLLNDPGNQAGPKEFSVGEGNLDAEVTIACSTLENVSPSGVTPLVERLREIRDKIAALEVSLRQTGTQVAVVLCTDGIPTDSMGNANDAVKSSFVQTLRSLEGLPVWMVVKLCTDEDDVVNYWNEVDNLVELSLEVLDDYTSEAREVHKLNPWLNYGLPLHRMREMGFYDKLFDLIDEQPLCKDELVAFFRILFGAGSLDGIADPEVDWKAFVRRIESLVQAEKKVWNPVTERIEPWVDVQRLKKEYGQKEYGRRVRGRRIRFW